MFSKTTAVTPLRSADMFLAAWNDPDLPESAIIPVENIQAPIFLTGGEDDGQWYSAVAADRIVTRLKENDSRHEIVYKGVSLAGHFIDGPSPVMNEAMLVSFHPVGKLWIDNGGGPAVMARAQREIFPELVEFFDKNVD